MTQSTGIGKVMFGGVDLTSAPYYAHLTQEAKYWFLDGQQSTQFITGPTSLVSSMPYFQTFLLHLVFRIEPEDGTRVSMIYALTQLTSVLDPSKGEQKLVFAEFPGSYFIAKKQTSALQNETSVPYMAELAVEFACTGPAYSNSESVVTVDVLDAAAEYILTSFGDTKAYPRWRFTTSDGYTGPVTWNNYTTSEQVTWTGTMAAGQTLDIIMDEYGISHTALLDGNPSTATVVGPAWPHVVPGENLIFFSGPSPGTLETRWRDRYLVGLQSATSIMTPRGADIEILKLPTLASGDIWQGMAWDGTYYYCMSLTDIYKLDASMNIITVRNNAAADVGCNHFGDGVVYNGVLYFIAASSVNVGHGVCGMWNTSDLSYIDEHVFPQNWPVSSGCILYDKSPVLFANGSLEKASAIQYGAAGQIQTWDLSTWEIGNQFNPSILVPYIEGMDYYDGHYYCAALGSYASTKEGGIFIMNADGTGTRRVIPYSMLIHGGELEGIDVKSDFIRAECGGYIYLFPTDTIVVD